MRRKIFRIIILSVILALKKANTKQSRDTICARASKWAKLKRDLDFFPGCELEALIWIFPPTAKLFPWLTFHYWKVCEMTKEFFQFSTFNVQPGLGSVIGGTSYWKNASTCFDTLLQLSLGSLRTAWKFETSASNLSLAHGLQSLCSNLH